MERKGKVDRGGRKRNNGGESEDGGAEMENCGSLCEGKYGGSIEKIGEVDGKEREESIIDDRRGRGR